MTSHSIDDDDAADDHHDDTDDAVNPPEDALVKPGSHLVNEPSEVEPPEQCAANDSQIAHDLRHEVIDQNEGELSEQGHEHKDDERIAHGDGKARHGKRRQTARLCWGGDVVNHTFLLGNGAERVESEGEEQHAAHNLDDECNGGVFDNVDNE